MRAELRRVADDLLAALRLGPTRIGLLGTFLILLGSLTPAYLPQNSPWWGPLRAVHLDTTPVRIIGTLILLTGIGLLVDAWFRFRPTVYADVKHWAVLAIWSLPLLGAPPTFSHDAYSYSAQGWMLVNDVSPYDAGPGVLPGAFADQVAWVWRFTPAPYGPLSLRLQELIVVVSGLHPYLSTVLMRIPALIGVVLIVVLLPRIAHRLGVDPQLTAWFATLNPLLVIDFVGGMHNDALMMGLVVLALWMGMKGRWWLGGAVVVGIAASIKQPAFLAAYALPLLTQPLLTWRRADILRIVGRILVSCALAIGAFVVVSLGCGLGFGWLNAVNVPGLVVTVSPSTVIGQGIQLVLNYFHLDSSQHAAITFARTVGLAISVAGVLLLAVTAARRKPMSFLSWSYLLVAFGGPALHSWYVLWGALLLPLTSPSLRVQRIALWTTMVLLSYSAVNLAWRNGALALGIAAIIPLGWQVIHHERRSRRELDVAEDRPS
ncbi:MAG: polyprenol phosphomannose-dependent alpha 1,6 mannosyltransferase MptB [Propionibacteriaceae bacterium]